jgi:phytoene dehydrogenase-like protein
MFSKKLSRRSFLTISAMTTAAIAFDWHKISSHAAQMGPKEEYPTVVIGAGLGGLCCGAYLARQGIPVSVIEQHSVPGGYATSFDRDGGRFTFEVSLHGTSVRNNRAEQILQNLGVFEKVSFVPLPEVYHIKTPTVDLAVPSQDPEEYILQISYLFPQEAEGIRSFVNEMLAITEEVGRWEGKSKWAQTLTKPVFPIRYAKMWNVRNKTLKEMLDEHVKDPEVQGILAGLWGYYGLPPSELSAFYYSIATGPYLKNGSYYSKHRSQDLSNALAEVIEEAGGNIIYDTAVEKIRVENGRVKSVMAGGDEIPARAVVSNASALSVFKEMIPPADVPKSYISKLESYRPSLSSFIVWLGLDRELRGKIKSYSTHVSAGNGPEADYKACLVGDIENCGMAVTVYDVLFEGYSAPGTSTVMLFMLSGYEPWRRFETDYRAGRKEAYQAEKERWTDVLIRKAEEAVIPGLSSMIQVKEAATPLTNWRYTGNTEGAIYGFEPSMDNAFMNRISNRTPIKGLYLSGAWGEPGGGYVGVLRSGEKTFGYMMEDWGKGG